MIINAKVNTHTKKNNIEINNNIYNIDIAAKPIKGKANEALIKLLAKHLKIPKSQILIIKGQRSKNKIIEIK
ncbi:MAG: hypothetical protein ACD_58C00324G0010 [uncultured bacterium]|nr:MAG: hypothetical protein ACD_58C00324G0010 [uncultured bacterium]